MNLNDPRSVRAAGAPGLLDDWIPLLGVVFSDRAYHLPAPAMNLLRAHVCAQEVPDPLLIRTVCLHLIQLSKDTNLVHGGTVERARRLLNALNIAEPHHRHQPTQLRVKENAMCECANRRSATRTDRPLYLNPKFLNDLVSRAAGQGGKVTPEMRAASAETRDVPKPFDSALQKYRDDRHVPQPVATPDAITQAVKRAHETGLPPNPYDLAIQEQGRR